MKPIKVISWNLEWFPGGEPYSEENEKRHQFQLISHQLSQTAPDIFLAQEIIDEVAFLKLVSQMPKKLRVHVCSRFLNEEENHHPPLQSAIASIYEIDSAFYEYFTHSENFPKLKRGFSFAALKHPTGGFIMAYSVHLKSNRGDHTYEGALDVARTRAESIRQILSHKEEMEKHYEGCVIMGWLIGGDFNTNHDGQYPLCTVIEDLQAAGFQNTWENVPKEQRITWHPHPLAHQFAPTSFDYIMQQGFREVDATTIATSRKISDHDLVQLLLKKALLR